MSRIPPSNDPDDDFGVEITSLDTPETFKAAADSLLQGSRLAPGVRRWLTILSVVGGLLLIFVVLSPILSSLLPKKTSAPSVFHASAAQIQDVTVQNDIAYITSSDGTFQARNVKNGSLLWKRNLGGIVQSFVNNTIYVDHYSKQESTVQALSAMNGTVLWTFKTSLDISPLIIDDGVVYPLFQVSSQGRILTALDGRSGSELWHYAMNVPRLQNAYIQATQDQIFISIGVNSQLPTMNLSVIKISDGSLLWHIKAESMQLFQGNIVGITTSDGALHMLRADNGHEVWHYKSSNGVSLSPFIGDRLLYMQTPNESVQALRPDNGALLWTYKDPWGVADVFQDINGVLYVETGDGFIVALRTSDGKRLWHVRPVAPPYTFGSVQVEGGIVYTFTTVAGEQNQTIAALRVSDGSLLWRRNVDTTASNDSLPAITNDQLFTDSGTTISVIRARDGAVLWHANYTDTMTMSRYSFGFLAIVGNIVILRSSDSALVAHQVKTGAILWRYPRG